MCNSVLSLLEAIERRGAVALLSFAAGAALLAVPAGNARADTNDLVQIGVRAHNDTGNDLSQLGIALHGGTYLASDGSVRFIPGDGSVRFISVGDDANAALCVHDVTTVGSLQDGASYTLLLTESIGLHFTGGSARGLTGVRDIIDGTSNTIFFPEAPFTQLCIGGVSNVDPVSGPNIADGTSNTITFGEDSALDLCLTRARLPTIVDGTSNTILLGETRDNVCFENIVVRGDLALSPVLAEPATLALAMAPMIVLFTLRRRAARPRGAQRA